MILSRQSSAYHEVGTFTKSMIPAAVLGRLLVNRMVGPSGEHYHVSVVENAGVD